MKKKCEKCNVVFNDETSPICPICKYGWGEIYTKSRPKLDNVLEFKKKKKYLKLQRQMNYKNNHKAYLAYYRTLDRWKTYKREWTRKARAKQKEMFGKYQY